MATIRRVVPSPPQSAFQNVASNTGAGFDAMASIAKAAYDYVLPDAIKQYEKEATDAAHSLAQQQIGNPQAPAQPQGASGIDLASYGVEGGARPDAISGMTPGFSASLSNMIASAPESVRAGLKIGSGYRSTERQAELWADALKKYGSPEAARKWVAPPGNSQHNHGNAADLKFADPAAKQWVHANAAAFGLSFPLANEDWHIEAAGARGGSAAPMGSYPPTTIRDADGALLSRLHSPASAPFRQAYNAAAGIAYHADMTMKATTDLMGISQNFLLDPQGFTEAANAYVSELVGKAPAIFQEDLRGTLTNEVQRRSLGILESQQSDIRQRAENSTTALAQKQSADLSAAIAGGDPNEINAAKATLQSTLRAKESLPGASWTPAQSDNFITAAEQDGQAAVSKQQSDQLAASKTKLNGIRAAREAGLISADEAMLDDPRVWQQHPEEAVAAAGAVYLGENAPSLKQGTPKAAAAFAASLEGEPITSPLQIATAKAAREMATGMAKAYGSDSVAAAQTFRTGNPPPALPDLTTPPELAVNMLKARKSYMDKLRAEGFTTSPANLSAAENEQYGAMFAKEVPVDMRLAASEMIAEGFGEQAGQVFNGLKGADPTTRAAGMMVAGGGSKPAAREAMIGRAMLDAGQSTAKFKYATITSIDPAFSEAMAGLPTEGMESEILAIAGGLFAFHYPEGFGPDDTAKAQVAAKEMLNLAYGADKDPAGKPTGGVQTVMDHPVLLPPGVRGSDVQDMFVGNSLGADYSGIGVSQGAAIGAAIGAAYGRIAEKDKRNEAAWVAAGIGTSLGSGPMMGGAPVTSAQFRNRSFKIKPAPEVGENAYRIYFMGQQGMTEVLDASGGIYTFDIQKLVDAGQ